MQGTAFKRFIGGKTLAKQSLQHTDYRVSYPFQPLAPAFDGLHAAIRENRRFINCGVIFGTLLHYCCCMNAVWGDEVWKQGVNRPASYTAQPPD